VITDDIKSIIIGIISGLLVIYIHSIYKKHKIRKIKDEIDLLEWEKSHIERMRRSSIEMSRSSFKALFIVLMFMSLANLIPEFFNLIGLGSIMLTKIVSLIAWLLVFLLAQKFWKRYDDIKNYKEYIGKTEKKIEDLRGKLD